MLSSVSAINNSFKRVDNAAFNIASSSLATQTQVAPTGSPAITERPVIQPQDADKQSMNSRLPTDNQSLTYHLTQLKQAEIDTKANVKVLQTEHKMLGTLLDIKA